MRDRRSPFLRSRRQTTWGMLACTAVLLAALGLPLPAAAVEPDADGAAAAGQPKTSWLGRMFGKSDSSNVTDPNGKRLPKADKIPSNRPSDVNRQEVQSLEQQQKKANALRMREEVKLLRRQEACDQLKNIAMETNNDALWRRAEELDQRAYSIYAQRVGKRLVNKAADADEQTLDKHLGEGTGARASRPDGAGRAKSGTDRNGLTATRGE